MVATKQTARKTTGTHRALSAASSTRKSTCNPRSNLVKSGGGPAPLKSILKNPVTAAPRPSTVESAVRPMDMDLARFHSLTPPPFPKDINIDWDAPPSPPVPLNPDLPSSSRPAPSVAPSTGSTRVRSRNSIKEVDLTSGTCIRQFPGLFPRRSSGNVPSTSTSTRTAAVAVSQPSSDSTGATSSKTFTSSTSSGPVPVANPSPPSTNATNSPCPQPLKRRRVSASMRPAPASLSRPVCSTNIEPDRIIADQNMPSIDPAPLVPSSGPSRSSSHLDDALSTSTQTAVAMDSQPSGDSTRATETHSPHLLKPQPPTGDLDIPVSVCTRFAMWLETQRFVQDDVMLRAVERDGHDFLRLAQVAVAFDDTLHGRVRPATTDGTGAAVPVRPLCEHARTLRAFIDLLKLKISLDRLSEELKMAVLRDGQTFLRLATVCLDFDQAVQGLDQGNAS